MAQGFSQHTTVDDVQGGNNYFMGLLVGLVAAVIGAAAWMGITVATNSHLGLVALGVGALVGFAVRFGGRGRTIGFGVMGAVLTAASCLSGEIATVIQISSSAESPFFTTLQNTDLAALTQRILEKTDVMSWVIYGIGVYEGYQFSIRK